jgi:hypothetical protein
MTACQDACWLCSIVAILRMLDAGLIESVCGEIETRFEALSKQEAAAEPQPGGDLYHYTSTEGLRGIVETGEIWATNALYLNDASELSDASDILRDELQSMDIRLSENAAFFLKGAWVSAESVPIDHFIVSFCEDGDLLGQWRGYGSQGTGFSLGFFFATFGFAAGREENKYRGGCTLRRVKYRPHEKKELIRKRVDIIREIFEPNADALEPRLEEDYRQLQRIHKQIAASLHPTLALMKHESFAEEREWRLVRTLWKPVVPTQEWPVKVRVMRDGLVPYLPIPWPLPSTSELDGKRGIKAVVCGPSANSALKEKAVRDLMTANKCWKVSVSRSQVPLRA